MAPHLTSPVLVDGVVLPAGTEETPQLRASIRNVDVWSGPTELSDDELQSALSPAAEKVAEDSGDDDGAVAEAIDAAVAAAKEELLDELRREVHRQIEELIGAVEPAQVNGQDGDADPAELVEPPRGGKGSGEPEWRAFADKLGVDVAGVSDRDGIIAAVDAHKAAQQ